MTQSRENVTFAGESPQHFICVGAAFQNFDRNLFFECAVSARQRRRHGRLRGASLARYLSRDSAYGLADAEQVPFAVAEPRAPLADTLGRVVAFDVGDAVDGAQAGDVDLLERHAAPS